MHWLLLGSAACTFVSDAEWQKRVDAECSDLTGFVDEDGDGFGGAQINGCEAEGAIPTGGDCDDSDPAVNPGAAEVYYDGLDQNCDGDVGDDQDGDGWPRASDCMDSLDDAVPVFAGDCADPTVVPDPAEVHPGADDVSYDGVDADCSGTTDFDDDEDGWRSCEECDDLDAAVNPAEEEDWYDGVDQDCDGNDDDQDLDGFAIDVDCDDEDAAINPAAEEVVYNTVDEDCDPTNEWDADGDGYDLGADCDDTDAATNPKATETWYDGVDQDCDGNDDDQDGDGASLGSDCDDEDAAIGPRAAEIWYDGIDQDCDGNDDDQDGDTFALSVDCDDTQASVNPAAAESWYDGIDQDCDGNDEDQDGDGWPVDTDCDDTLASVRPDATEDCATAFDDDCDEDLDARDAANCVPWFEDTDLDGFGGTGTLCYCEGGAGRAARSDDCDDADAAVSPAAAEDCATAVDDDCDGEDNDLDALGCADFHADADADGLGDAAAVCRCTLEPDLTTDARDCDDHDASIGLPPSWFADRDLDGLGDDTAFVEGCTLPVGASDVGGDCDDGDATVLGPTAWFSDADGDGYGDDATGFVACSGEGAVGVGADCDDADAAIHPGATEDCATGADDDCSGTDNDEGALGGACWYADVDGDGIGADTCVLLCRPESPIDAPIPGDCDDTLSTVYPGAPEACGNGVDEDCIADTCVISGTSSLSASAAVLHGESAYDLAGRAVAGGPAGVLVSGFAGGLGRVWLWSDPLAGPANLLDSQARFLGGAPYDGIGDAVAFGDDVGSIAVVGGAHVSAWSPDGGVVLVFDTTLTGPLGPPDSRLEIGPSTGGQALGSAVGAAGDPVDDGVEDPWFAVGAPGYGGVGAVALVGVDRVGALLVEDADQLIVGVDGGGELGRALAGDVDVDGDGLDDLVMTAPRASGGLGAVFILDDPSVTTTADVTRVIVGAGGAFGQAVAVASTDDSGEPRLVVGAPEAGTTGAVWLLPADATGTDDALATVTGDGDGDALGRALAAADADGDGVDDLCFGIMADGYVAADAGAALFFHGPLSGAYVAGDATAVRYGEVEADAAGSNVAALPDWNGDGLPEWLIAVPGADTAAAEAGSIRVVYGSGD